MLLHPLCWGLGSRRSEGTYAEPPIGHNRLQYPPDTAKWRHVVETLALGGDVSAVAEATLSAAEHGLELAARDKGLTHAVWLLAKVVQASRETDLVAALRSCSVEIPANAAVADVIAGLSDAIDRRLAVARSRTDLGEIAQMAAVEALSATAGAAAAPLFGESIASTQATLRSFSTDQGFATLAHGFFTRFVERYLTYHLSRELSQHVGENQRFTDPRAHNEFLESVRQHSSQVASIVRQFASGWYSKSNWETGLSEDSARRFASYCVTKIRSEIGRRRCAARVAARHCPEIGASAR